MMNPAAPDGTPPRRFQSVKIMMKKITATVAFFRLPLTKNYKGITPLPEEAAEQPPKGVGHIAK
jgi:hypothetical protein